MKVYYSVDIFTKKYVQQQTTSSAK